MNKILKAIVIGSFVLVAIVFAFIGFVFYKLPNAKTFSKVFKQSGAPTVNTTPAITTPNAVSEKITTSTATQPTEQINDAADEILKEKVFRDLTAPDTPLSNFCGSLKNAKTGELSSDGFENALLDSVDPETQDPRIQAAKPLLRYVLRLPNMTQFMADIGQGAQKQDQGMVDKAQFYASAFSAFTEMKQHQTDLESVLDRGYIFIGLNNLVAKKPELLGDPKVQSFCNNTETLFNQASPVDFDREKKDFLNLLKDSGVSPKDIGFDPQYKSKLDLRLTGSALTFDGGWLEDLIKDDQTVAPDASIQ